MWYHILNFMTITVLTQSSHVLKNDSAANPDIIVTYAGHAEALDPPKPIITPKPVTNTPKPVHPTDTVRILIPESFATETTVFYEDETESVVFVPNEKPVFRMGDYHDERERVNIGDLMVKKTVNDVYHRNKIRAETESPSEDILFISGKNNENIEKPRKDTVRHYEYNTRGQKETKPKKVSLDCFNLDCNNTLKSVCGGKMENKQWKYRLFLNECYFRRVNCDFKYASNRYRELPEDLCRPIGSHYSERPFVYNPPLPILPRETPSPIRSERRSFSSRRSLNIEMDGSFCSHPCPSSCPDDYSPECAVTSRGHRKVFVNHCKLDFNSCSYGTVWHRRPLSECVGNQKADIRQNRAFIGWMQRVGIVDGKGRLSMN